MTAADLAAGLEPALAARWHELVARLADARQRHPDAALASSLAAEDMVLIQLERSSAVSRPALARTVSEVAPGCHCRTLRAPSCAARVTECCAVNTRAYVRIA